MNFTSPQTIKRKATEDAHTKATGAGGLRFVDLFCGIGGFHLAASELGMECVYASDIDDEARRSYEHNFGLQPDGDITKIKADQIPDHDILFAGFPCQPFSIIGDRKGFGDIRGTLFFEIVKVLKAKKPQMILLENVKQLVGHDKGRTLKRIMKELETLGYSPDCKVLNALDFGLPQKRERVLIAGSLSKDFTMNWPEPNIKMKPLSKILVPNPDDKHFVSERIRRKRYETHKSEHKPAIWHENKSGNISSYPYSCALRAGASYNYLLVDGKRRLTPREMLRLQGFPDSFEILSSDTQARKQAGNSVPVPMILATLKRMVDERLRKERLA